MAVMDEFRKEREAIRNESFRKKAGYFWQYYKWNTILILGIIICIGSIIYTHVTEPKIELNGIFLNATSSGIEERTDNLLDNFLNEKELNLSKDNFLFDTSLVFLSTGKTEAITSNYSTFQVLQTQSASGKLDFIIGDAIGMTTLSYRDYFADLRTILTEEQLLKYEPYMCYMDLAFMEEMKASLAYYDESVILEYPDCKNPAAMKNPVPVLIDVSASKEITNVYNFPIDTPVFGIVCTTHLDMTLKFMDFLLTE